MDHISEFKAYYDGSYESALPKELSAVCDVIECLGCTEGCDTLLVHQKATGKKMVAKCYKKTDILFDAAEAVKQKEIENDAIPRFMGEYQNEEYYCIVREYIEGVSLEEFVKKNRMTEDILLDIAIALADTMKALHTAEPVIIHRDIKPQNIIVKEDGGIVLIDFGISRVFQKDEAKTRDTVFGGTVDFASPEQYGFRQTDVRSDIYSFGIVLSWMITGKSKPLREPLTKLERIAAKCCEFAPDKRYQSDKALVKDLHKITRQHRLHVRKVRRNAALISLFLAALLAGGFFVPEMLYQKDLYQHAVVFREPLIEKAVRVMLDKPQGAITDADLENVTELYIQAEEVYASRNDFYIEGGRWYETDSRIRGTVTELTDIEKMPNLRILCIGGEYIKDISPISGLEYLQQLDLRDNEIEDVSPIADKRMLSQLSLGGNPLKGIEAVSTLPSLRILSLDMTGDYDASPLADLGEMDILAITYAPDAYRHLQGLHTVELSIGSPGQTDLECIKETVYIQKLLCSNSDIRDISALSGREDILYVDMTGCAITDLSPLFMMPNLMTAELSAKAREQMEELISVYGEPAFEVRYIQ